jgi:hypothetical protein
MLIEASDDIAPGEGKQDENEIHNLNHAVN